jgi:ATP-dependent helicase/nuclease subunit A
LDSTKQAAKSSVTALRRETAEELEAETPFSWKSRFRPAGDATDPAEVGIAHHRFLQSVDLSKVAQPGGCEDELKRLVEARLLSPQQRSMVDVASIARFWNSELGRNILACASSVRREIEFTARLTRETDPEMEILSRIPDGEFIVVQGAVDLAVILPNEIWIVDFKTDDVRGKNLEERARQYSIQLRLYGAALSQIYGKPVTQQWLHFLKPGRTIAP